MGEQVCVSALHRARVLSPRALNRLCTPRAHASVGGYVPEHGQFSAADEAEVSLPGDIPETGETQIPLDNHAQHAESAGESGAAS